MTYQWRKNLFVAVSSLICRNLLVIFDQSETLQIRQNLSVIFNQSATSQIRQISLAIFDQSATSQIRQNLLVIFDQSTTSQRHRRYFEIHASFLTRFVEIYWSFSTNMQRCSDVADSSKFIGHFWPICDVAATLQIRQNSLVIFLRSFVVDSS